MKSFVLGIGNDRRQTVEDSNKVSLNKTLHYAGKNYLKKKKGNEQPF